jgi:Tol biopolymer transport system component
VKVLDFGLAKAVAPSFSPAQSDADLKVGATDSPTLSALATQAGMILGTAAYMSPEQAKGQPVDRRCDIWAFGCVLYEMLAGRKAFEGETISDVLAAVIRAEPEWNAIPETTPPAIHRLVRRCLRKDQRQRLQAIGEARIAIEETLSGSPLLTSPLPQGEGGPAERDRVRVSPLRRALPWAVAAILVCIAAIAGWWIGTRGAAPSPNWSGDLLPGPTIAFFPRVSPDGHLIAFQAMLDNVTQVAVMDPGSGNWTVLTHDRTAGLVSNLCWSPDGSRIYFDRFISQPVGVYSVPALGGEERLVLDGAANPEALPDGSLLVVRIDPDRRSQIYHFGPDTGRLEALGAWVILNPSAPVRIFPGGKEAVFFGTVKGAESGNSPHLYLLDIATGSARRLAPELPIVQSSQLFPLAVTPDGKSVLIDLPSGSLHRIIAIPRSGTSPVRTLIMLTSMPWSLDVASDGNLYVDQVERPLEILRLPLSGGTPEVLESVESYTQYNAAPVEFPDERLLLPTLISGRPRLLLGKPGGSFVPLLETNEDSAPPMAQAGDDEVALMAGTPPGRMLTIASMKEGRIIHRFEATEGKRIDAVAASPDGKSLYYVSSGTVWSVPSQGGNPRKICAGDGIAVDPSGGDLIVNLNEQHHVRLERVPLSGGPVQSLQVRSDLPISPIPLGPNSLDKNGRLLVSVAPKDSWFFRLAILNLATGKLAQVPLNYTGDIMTPGWARDGRVLTTADPIRARIWRFRPVH